MPLSIKSRASNILMSSDIESRINNVNNNVRKLSNYQMMNTRVSDINGNSISINAWLLSYSNIMNQVALEIGS